MGKIVGITFCEVPQDLESPSEDTQEDNTQEEEVDCDNET